MRVRIRNSAVRRNAINLHLNKKSVLSLVITYIAVLLVISTVVIITTREGCAQLLCLLKSDYVYSATQIPASNSDDYYQYDAGITFKTAEDSNKGINADVLMQNDDSVYTESVYWNADMLDVYEIAVSENLAREYDLSIGDVLFSKHIIDGEVYQYSVVQLLPEMMCVRVLDNQQHNAGVIVMGYDERYVDNISSLHLIFTNESVNEMYGSSSGTLSDIVYRSDEITSICSQIAPYALLYIILAIIATVIYVLFINRTLSHNMKRLIMLGWEKRVINSAYSKYVLGVGIPSLLLVSLVVCGCCVICGMSGVIIGLFLMTLILEVLAILISSAVCLNRIWRS